MGGVGHALGMGGGRVASEVMYPHTAAVCVHVHILLYTLYYICVLIYYIVWYIYYSLCVLIQLEVGVHEMCGGCE
jgi:hypothetical protein